LNQRVRTAAGIETGLALHRQGMQTARIQKHFPRTAEIFPPRKVEVDTIQSRVVHNRFSRGGK
jgi:hypothetical protein